jgi:Carboxypeptidase regulatory-like domain
MRYFAASLFLFTATASFAQVATSRSTAPSPGAKVEILKKSENQSFSTKTDQKGHWAVPSLASDTYKVTVTQTAFKTSEVAEVMLDVAFPRLLT